MDIVSLFGGIKNYDKGLLKITNLVNNTMGELGMPVKELNLGPPTTIPYYDGIKSQVAAEFINEIKNASGVILATTAGICGVSSALQTFLEHLEVEPDILKHKNCMVIVLSSTGDTSEINSLSKMITTLGGYDSVRIFLDDKFFGTQNNKQLVEKQIEDFYRIVRQKRKFYTPKVGSDSHAEYPIAPSVQSPQPQTYVPPTYMQEQNPYQEPNPYRTAAPLQPSYPPIQPQPPIQTPPPQAMQPAQTNSMLPNMHQGSFVGGQAAAAPQIQQPIIAPEPITRYKAEPDPSAQNMTPYNGSNISSVVDNFNKRQSEDIQEITSFFSKKYTGVSTPEPSPQYQSAPFPGKKTPRQLTASLIHHYQPQLAGDLACTIQLNISGSNGFTGYIFVNNTDCYYYDGQTDNPTLTVISDEADWISVITGKVSAQKAFMTGSLKIKGNFVMLTRFDQIFNTAKNYA